MGKMDGVQGEVGVPVHLEISPKVGTGLADWERKGQ